MISSLTYKTPHTEQGTLVLSSTPKFLFVSTNENKKLKSQISALIHSI